MSRVMPSRLVLVPLALLAGGWSARAQAPGNAPVNVAHPLPPQTPPWLEGYQVRWPVRVLGEFSKQPDAKTVLVRLAAGGWLRPDASDLAVQAGDGKLLPTAVLSHDPLGGTVVQFPRHGDDPWYWLYGVHAKGAGGPKADPKTLREGITLEVRDWLGDELSSWAKVRAGLEKSAAVIGNAVVGDVLQNCCPARPDQSRRFAASYRGHLQVKKEGTYRFVLSADDASFLFIDGFKVFERPGTNRTIGTIKHKELEKLAGKVDLKPGVHDFEVHQAVGDRPDATGVCALLWSPPGETKFTFVPPAATAHPLYARAAALERPDGECPGPFVGGLDDLLEAPGVKLFLVRFEAQGPVKGDDAFTWDFGDGTTGKGRSPLHVYFKEGDYTITLNAGAGMPPFRQRLHVWPEPGENGPLSLGRAVAALAAMPWQKLDATQVRQIFAFLQVCNQPNRWALLDAVAQHLLAQPDVDREFRAQLYLARLEALTELGKAGEALKLAAAAQPEFAKTPALQVRVQIGVAAIHQYHYRDAAAASNIYKAIIDENRRVEHPNLRLAAVRWGDLFAEAGDLARASETYALAAQLGGDKLAGGTTTDASTRGALLRIAEQKLKAGDTGAARFLLDKLELEYPGRRLDGLYCFLRAEAERVAGHYEDALRAYEMIFKLPQWAGYRDKASAGIADCYLRMEKLDKALTWLGNLKEAAPKFYEEHKLAEVEKVTAERLERVKAAQASGAPGAAFFRGFTTGFEPDESEWFGDLKGFASVRAPGMAGPHVMLLDVFPRDMLNSEYDRPLKNLTPGATYHVEVWYHDIVRPSPLPGHQPHVTAYLFAEAPAKGQATAQQIVYANAHHRWHKLSFKLKAPTTDCQWRMTWMNMTGFVAFDRLSIRPVSDRDLDSLAAFLEGQKTP